MSRFVLRVNRSLFDSKAAAHSILFVIAEGHFSREIAMYPSAVGETLRHSLITGLCGVMPQLEMEKPFLR